jgi:hypothetical protein
MNGEIEEHGREQAQGFTPVPGSYADGVRGGLAIQRFTSNRKTDQYHFRNMSRHGNDHEKWRTLCINGGMMCLLIFKET